MPVIQCKACGGTGKINLSGIYAETHTLLKKSGETHAAAMARKAGCTPTAMSNRLAALESHGLATSRQYGRKRLYKAK